MRQNITVEKPLLAMLLVAFATACGSSSSLVAVDPTESSGDVAVSLEVEPESKEDEKDRGYGSEDPDLELVDDFESIVGGTPANISQYPFMVGLVNLSDDGTRFTQFCGGTLIRPNWVLTAAHCFVDRNGRPISRNNLAILEGSADLTRTNPIRVSEVRTFPGFSTNGNVFNNDVALLRLSRNSSQPTVAIATSSSIFAPGQTATTIGWGRTRNGDPDSSSVRQLRQVDVPIQRDLICSLLYPGTYVDRNMICAGGLDTNRGSCQGDSGGPLLVRRNNSLVQIGITSFGFQCGVVPAGYTEVPTYLDWINQQIGGSQPPPVTPPQQQGQIGVPGSINGRLTSSDRDNPTRRGRRFQDFRLTGASSGTRVQIDLRSSDFDAYLQLVDANTGRVITFNDDGGGSTNSRLTFTVEAGRSYAIRVTTFDANEVGSFTLSTQQIGGSQTPPPPVQTPTPTPTPVQTPIQRQIGVPGSINGRLTSSDPDNSTLRPPGSKFQDFRLTGASSGTQVQIDLRSNDFNAYLQLVDANTGRVIAFNDNFGGSTNSRLTFTVESGRSYAIRVTAYVNQVGSFTLSTQRVF